MTPIRTGCRRNSNCTTTPVAFNFLCPAANSPLETQFHYNDLMTDQLLIAGRSFRSRLIVGTGKYKSFEETARARGLPRKIPHPAEVRRVSG